MPLSNRKFFWEREFEENSTRGGEGGCIDDFQCINFFCHQCEYAGTENLTRGREKRSKLIINFSGIKSRSLTDSFYENPVFSPFTIYVMLIYIKYTLTHTKRNATTNIWMDKKFFCSIFQFVSFLLLFGIHIFSHFHNKLSNFWNRKHIKKTMCVFNRIDHTAMMTIHFIHI